MRARRLLRDWSRRSLAEAGFRRARWPGPWGPTTTWLILGGLGLVAGCAPDASLQEAQSLRRQEQRVERSREPDEQEQIAKAVARLDLGDVESAQAVARKLMIANPDAPAVILLNARCLAARGELTEAVELLQSMADPAERAAALWLAVEWLTEANQLDEATRTLQSVLEQEGPSVRIHRRLARLFNNQGRRQEAAVHLRALARSGAASEMELFAMNSFADPFIDESLPPPDLESELTMSGLAAAKRMWADGQHDETVQLVGRLRDRFPAAPSVAAFQGFVYLQAGRTSLFQRWLTLLPPGIEQEPEYWRAVGHWFLGQGERLTAARCFAEAAHRDDTDRFAYLGLARALNAEGRSGDAAAVMERFALLEESTRIARDIGRAPGTREQLERMADILEELRRPWEALGWQELALQRSGTDEERQAVQARRETLLQATVDTEGDHWRTCGLDVSEWPLPSGAPFQNPSTGRNAQTVRRSVEPIQLVNVAATVGLDFTYDNGDDPSDDSVLIHQLTGGGIGVIDFDLDGWPDVYCSQAGGDAFGISASKSNQLFRNLAATRFAEVSDGANAGDAGYGQGVAAADLNQDGFVDLVIANIGTNTVLINNGDGSFARRELAGAEDWTTSIACGDLDGDHLPEIVAINYIDDPAAMQTPCVGSGWQCNPHRFRPADDKVRWSRPEGGVSDPQSLGTADPAQGFAAIIANIDARDGNDLFVANDVNPNHFWQSQPDADGGFALRECARLIGCATGPRGTHRGCMGVAAGDFDRNAKPDLHVTNYWNQSADLYLQQGEGMFDNETIRYGVDRVTRRTVGWGTVAVDFERDGWLDLAVLNGHLSDQRDEGIPYQMYPQLLRGGPDTFELVSVPGRQSYWNQRSHGRTMATFDWNRDGLPDLLAGHLDAPVALLENRTVAGNWLQLELVGTRSERDAVGVEVAIEFGETQLTAWVTGGDGLLCTHEPFLDFGVGAVANIERVTVRWPHGRTEQFSNVSTNSRYLVVEGAGELFAR